MRGLISERAGVTAILALLVSALVSAQACEPVNSIEVEELAGTWIASQARFVEIAAPKRNNIDLIELDYEVTFIADATGSFDLFVDAPDDEDDDFVTGVMIVDGKNLAITTDRGGSGAGEVFLEDDQVAFRLTAGLTYDFKGDGSEIPARLLLVMDRE